jgi:hypothetical protein
MSDTDSSDRDVTVKECRMCVTDFSDGNVTVTGVPYVCY